MTKVVCVELGGNIQADHYLPRAMEELRARFNVLKVSQVWETPPVGCEGCENFLNAAALIQTDRSLEELKTIFRQIEKDLDRVRTADKFAPRTIDIDTLVYDGVVVEPELWAYAHLAVPVGEIMPEVVNEKAGKVLGEVAEKMQREQLIKLRADVRLI